MSFPFLHGMTRQGPLSGKTLDGDWMKSKEFSSRYRTHEWFQAGNRRWD